MLPADLTENPMLQEEQQEWEDLDETSASPVPEKRSIRTKTALFPDVKNAPHLLYKGLLAQAQLLNRGQKNPDDSGSKRTTASERHKKPEFIDAEECLSGGPYTVIDFSSEEVGFAGDLAQKFKLSAGELQSQNEELNDSLPCCGDSTPDDYPEVMVVDSGRFVREILFD